MKILYRFWVLIVISNICFFANAQQWQWANKLGTSNSNTAIVSIEKYLGNHILIAGSYASANLNFGNLNLQNSGQDDTFFAICDNSGIYNWAVNIGGSAKDYASAIASDQNGNIYLAGNFNSLTLTVNGSSITNSGDVDAFLIKYNPDKTFGWIRKIGGLQKDEISAIVANNDGNIYLTVNSPDYISLYKISTNNTILWQKNISINNQSGKSTSLIIEGNQNLYIAGGFAGKISFNGIDTIQSTKELSWISGTYEPISNAFIAKFNSSGIYQNSVTDSNFYEINQAVFNANAIYTCGERRNSFQVIAGPTYPQAESKIYIGKYSQSLIKEWLKTVQNADSWSKTLDIPIAITNDENSNIYVAGLMHSNNLLFNNDTIKNIPKGFFYYSQAFVIKYNQTGDEIWYKTLGGKLNDVATSIVVNAENDFYLAGNFDSDSMLISNNLLINDNNLDSFIVHASTPVYFRKTMAFLTKFSDNSSSVNNLKLKEKYFYPNPFQSFINLFDESEYELRDLQSRLLRKGKSDIIDTKNLPKGIYLLTLNKLNTYKVIKN